MEYSRARYCFLLYALVAFGGLFTARQMSRHLEDSNYQMSQMLTERNSELEVLDNGAQSATDQNREPEEHKEEEAKLPDGDQDFYQG